MNFGFNACLTILICEFLQHDQINCVNVFCQRVNYGGQLAGQIRASGLN